MLQYIFRLCDSSFFYDFRYLKFYFQFYEKKNKIKIKENVSFSISYAVMRSLSILSINRIITRKRLLYVVSLYIWIDMKNRCDL